MYQPSCEDVRCRIIVEVQALDPHDGVGKAIAITPKFLLDALVRKNLENILQQGFGKFVISYFDSATEKIMDGNLEITKDMLKINVLHLDGTCNTDFSVYTSFSVGFPQVILHLSDCKRLIIVLDDTKPKITLQCLSRTSRDVIVMAMRVFSIELYLLHSKALENISSGAPPYGKIEMALEIDEVVQQMNYLAQQNGKLKKEKKRCQKELGNMEIEMENTIDAYRTLLDCNNIDQVTDLDAEVKKVKDELDCAIENKRKNRKKLREKDEKIAELQRELDEIKESQQNLVWELKESKGSLVEPDFLLESQKKDLECQRAFEEIGELSRKLQESKEELGKKDRDIEKLQQDLKDNTLVLQECAQFKHQNEALLGQRGILSKKIEGLTIEISEINAKLFQEQESHKETQKRLEAENLILKQTIENSLEEHKTQTNPNILKQTQDDVIKYRQQCDNLAGQLSRLQAQLRKNK